jgi:hypothetical protein
MAGHITFGANARPAQPSRAALFDSHDEKQWPPTRAPVRTARTYACSASWLPMTGVSSPG